MREGRGGVPAGGGLRGLGDRTRQGGCGPGEFWWGLSDLLERLEDVGVTDPSRNVWVAATPGFKPEAAVLTLVASLFGKPVFYVHEVMNELVEIPPAMPVVTDPGFVLGLIELRRRLGDGAPEEVAEEVLNDLARDEEERERYKLFLVEDPRSKNIGPSPLARLAESFLALGLLAAKARNYSVEIRTKGHTVPVSRGGGVKKVDRATLRELPLEDDTLEVLATVAALEGVDDTLVRGRRVDYRGDASTREDRGGTRNSGRRRGRVGQGPTGAHLEAPNTDRGYRAGGAGPETAGRGAVRRPLTGPPYNRRASGHLGPETQKFHDRAARFREDRSRDRSA